MLRVIFLQTLSQRHWVKASGLDAIDAGGLARAHELEALGFLQLTLANDEKIGWSGGFGVVR